MPKDLATSFRGKRCFAVLEGSDPSLAPSLSCYDNRTAFDPRKPKPIQLRATRCPTSKEQTFEVWCTVITNDEENGRELEKVAARFGPLTIPPLSPKGLEGLEEVEKGIEHLKIT